MNKKINSILKIVFTAIVVFVEEYLSYVAVLSNVMTKRSLYMRLTFIFGSVIISVVNIIFVVFSARNSELKQKKISFLIISSLLASIVLIILSLLFDKPLLAEVDYRNEIYYFAILIFSLLIDIWTSIFVLVLKLLVKNKR